MDKRIYDFDASRISNYLNKHASNLRTLYPWEFNLESLRSSEILTQKEIESISTLKESTDESFDADLAIRKLLKSKLLSCHSNDTEFNKISRWIIRDWGGIRGGSDQNTFTAVREFLDSESAFSFNRVASTSKVAAFMYPEKYVIYDSRVAYSLNWIILSEHGGDIFFPIPESQNSKLTAFNMNVLIRLSNTKHYKVNPTKAKLISSLDNQLFIPKKDAYVSLTNLLQQVSVKLFPEESNQLLYTEMLLFSIADKQIYSDITSRVKFTIT